METVFGSTQLMLEKGDITKHAVDAIVNPTTPHLIGGGSVAAAIHRAGGRAIAFECRQLIRAIGRLQPGKAVITGGGILPAKHVIHTAGPVWQKDPGRAAWVLAGSYKESLVLAEKMALKTIGFPSIGTGMGDYPVREASQAALESVKAYLLRGTTLVRVVFILYSDEHLHVYQETLQALI
ncbi:macro domain-containing protein [bacterium]|nr:macro domain-containing protein [bacterium]